VGDREKRGREKRGHKVEFPRWWEAREKGKNYATLYKLCFAIKKMKSGGTQQIQGRNQN